MSRIDRRRFLARGAAGALALASGSLAAPRFVFASGGSEAPSRFVFLILRGALDGLAAVPPYGDPDYAALRRELTIPMPGARDGALKLDERFGLHPSLVFLHEAHGAGELAVVHAVASPYRERSHFDGQDVLEGGGTRPHELASGWLNRALAALPAAPRRVTARGLALGQNVPLVMRGPAEVASWSPARLPAADEDTLQRLGDLYAEDPLLSRRLAEALAAEAIAEEAGTKTPDAVRRSQAAGAGPRGLRGQYLETVKAAAGFLQRADGPQVAVFDTGGWDTHANEGGARGLLATRLGVLDAALRTFREALGPRWRDMVVLVATEFGRTAAANGTRGSDHGTGAAAFLLGGAVRGGRMLCDWPGLASGALYQRRDLAPTTDLRAIIAGVLRDHLGVSEGALRHAVFPGGGIEPRDGLIRA